MPARATIIARTSNGAIVVDGISGNGELDSSNGSISVNDVEGEYISSTSNGSVNMSNISGQFEAHSSNGNIVFSGSFDAHSDNRFTISSGSITVEFQDDPNIEIDAQTSNGTVETELPILTTATSKKTRLKGIYGDGSATLEMTTSNGSIRLR